MVQQMPVKIAKAFTGKLDSTVHTEKANASLNDILYLAAKRVFAVCQSYGWLQNRYPCESLSGLWPAGLPLALQPDSEC